MSRIELVLPRLGESVEEGTITVWHVEEGESVSAGEVLLEVSTDKVETEIEAPADCTVEGITAPEGTTVEVGARLAWLVTGIAAEPAPTGPETSHAPVTSDEPTPVPAPTSPPEPETSDEAAATSNAGEPAAVRGGVEVARPVARLAPLSPVVRRLLAESGLRPDEVSGTGANRRIRKSDVLAAAAAPRTAPRTAPSIVAPPPAPVRAAEQGGSAHGPIDFLHITVDLGGLSDPAESAPSRRARLGFALARTIERHPNALGTRAGSIGIDGRQLVNPFDLRLSAFDQALDRASGSSDEAVELWDLVDSPLSGAGYVPGSPATVAVLTVQRPRPEVVTGTADAQMAFSVRAVSTISLAIRSDVVDRVTASNLLVDFASLVEQTDWSKMG